MAFLIDTNVIRAIHLVLISERRGSIVTSLRTKFIRRVGLSRIESKRVCTTRGDNDRHRRNRTEREGRKGGEGEKKPKRDSAERDESMKASGFIGGEGGGERGRLKEEVEGDEDGFEWMRILQSARFDFALTARVDIE